MEEPQQFQPPQPLYCVRRVLFCKDQKPLVAQPRARQSIDESGPCGLSKQSLGPRLEMPFESLFEADRTKDSRGVIFKASLVQNTDGPSSQVLLPSVVVDEPADLLTSQLDRHGVDGEITSREILA